MNRYKMYNGNKVILVLAPISLLITSGLFYILLNTPRDKELLGNLVFILLMATIVYPFFFAKKIKKIFTRDIIFNFNPDSFIVEIFDYKNINILKKYEYNYNELKGYSFYFTGIDTTHLVINLRNGKTKDFGIKDGYKTDDVVSDENSFIRTFHSHIIEYNKSHQNNCINVNAGFLSSENGTITLIILAVIFIIAFIMHVLLNPSSSYITLLVGLFMIINVLVVKKNSNNTLNQLLELSENT